MKSEWTMFYERSNFVGCNPIEVGNAARSEIDDLRELLRDVYDVSVCGATISGGLRDRIRNKLSFGVQ